MSEIQGIQRANVSAWLEANVEGAVGPFEFSLIAGGRSNLTYRVSDANGVRRVLRRPPLGHVLATAHDMAREHRIITGVGQTSVPVAKALGMCTDEAVNDAPFYVMDYIDGVVLDSPEAAEPFSTQQRVTAAHSLIDVMVQLHSVDPSAIGLGELGKREGYLDRQLRRWTTQWDNSKTRELPAIDRVVELLREKKPEQHHTGIVHGDYRLGNCMVSKDTGAVIGVLDWELCTLGDLMADVGYLLVYYTDATKDWSRANDPSGAGGFPSRQELLDRYALASGRDLSGVAYYEAFSCWRLACIAEGVLARYKHGAMGELPEGVDFDVMDEGVVLLVDRALHAVESLR
jgi:aminoglycoside phosphotransferase (APT) family kinase protein